MGRKNYDSLPEKFKPLPNRTNIVVTRQKAFKAPGCIVCNSIDKALDICRNNGEREAFVIGGAEIYEAALPIANRLYLTEIHAIVDGDTYFPEFDKDSWTENLREKHSSDDNHLYSFDFVIYDRKDK